MMTTATMTRFPHAEPIPLVDIPLVTPDEFRREILDQVARGARIAALFGYPQDDGRVRLYGVLAHDEASALSLLAADVGDGYPALTPDCPQAHWFEREIAEQWGVVPRGHPWLKPIRFHRSYRAGCDAWSRPASEAIEPSVPPAAAPFFRVEGPEVHEVAVGPVHAGVIEPGHFRFQCHGEHVFHLEISLGYQHRGVERALVGGPDKRTIYLMEQVAGDTSVGHATAYCQVVEALAGGVQPSLRAQALRGVALELERLANHTGDLGALAGDVGFLPTASYCGRIRGDFLNATALLCGSRFGRGLVRPGGVAWDVDASRAEQLVARSQAALEDVIGAANLLWDSLSVQSRFEDTGRVARPVAEALGLVGPAARACGVDRDVRHDFPTGIYRFAYIPISTRPTGDVFARAFVRKLEIRRSARFVVQHLQGLPEGPVRVSLGELRPEALAVSLVEGWRGEICHVAITDERGRFAHYKVVDPSFHNWIGLAMALRDQQISDFPLCNKSFNLSYCGHDL
jgi:Ni,Fe-hydrogenase III large subunit